MKYLLSIILSVLTFLINDELIAQLNIKNGQWTGQLNLEDDVYLPFAFIYDKGEFTVKNGEERIVLNQMPSKTTIDSVNYYFPNFDSFLRITSSNKKKLSGYWQNNLKGEAYKIPFTASYTAFPKSKKYATVEGRWETTFSTETVEPYPALGIFKQDKNNVTGTFLTETGDYRFLSGYVKDSTLLLGAFDGSHAFLFTAKISDTLKGMFYSGKHWKTNWKAIQNSNFELRHPDSITFIRNESSPLSFSLPDLENSTYTYPNEKLQDKVVIIQLMGSWCPNCLDETIFYKELLTVYRSRGLEIITVCYEIPKTIEQKIQAVNRLKERNNLDFVFLIGGDAQKNLASSQFPQLNKVVSFPTSLFVGKDGTVRRVHTGFTGPGTGEYYLEYKEKTIGLIEQLLSE
jgi:thiol-disulfide isomerase/thioredoxin